MREEHNLYLAREMRNPSMDHPSLERDLSSNDNSYFVDTEGNAYEPYSLAWRYLGMYLDCDLEEGDALQDDEEANGSGEENDCSRKLLWAAVSTVACVFRDIY